MEGSQHLRVHQVIRLKEEEKTMEGGEGKKRGKKRNKIKGNNSSPQNA